MITASFKSASIVESLHLRTSIVEDPIFVSNLVEESVHLFMTCLDLRTPMTFGNNAYAFKLWVEF